MVLIFAWVFLYTFFCIADLLVHHSAQLLMNQLKLICNSLAVFYSALIVFVTFITLLNTISVSGFPVHFYKLQILIPFKEHFNDPSFLVRVKGILFFLRHSNCYIYHCNGNFSSKFLYFENMILWIEAFENRFSYSK